MAAKHWGSIRLRAPFWLVVSGLLLFCGLFVVGEDEAKGRVALLAVGTFGFVGSLAAIVHGRIRSRRDDA